MIVWLASYPRSGNTFARLAMHRMYGVAVPDVYSGSSSGDASTTSPVREEYAEFFSGISLDKARATKEIMLVKTHELPADDAPAIYLLRDGRDALVSHAHYVLQCDRRRTTYDAADFVDVLRQLIEADDSFGGWSQHVLAWRGRRAPTAVMHFADLIASPEDALRAAVAQLALPLTERPQAQIPSFNALHDLAPAMFRRGVVGSWRSEMTNDLHQRFWQRHGAAMQAVGFERDERVNGSTAKTTFAA